ncbi:hypothetical protein ACTQ49_11110 [Luteococcus sp. Sow4_B9]|uniref:hypothetical protein n=1 Tax=Luteococcus sp. Sow4_B9 TaxID=3438792 RepID=UPI003F97A408
MTLPIVLEQPKRIFHPAVGVALMAAVVLATLVAGLTLGPTPAVVASAWLSMAACAGYAVSGST